MTTHAPAIGTARAMRLASPQTYEPVRIPLGHPGPGEVLVRIEGCGVCASNVPPWRGASWFQYPFEPGAPGHEGWGVVTRVGAGVQSVEPGDRVTFLSTHAFADHAVVGEGVCVRLPESLAGQACPGEPLACAVNIARRADMHPGQSVAIIGAGFLGCLLVQMAARAGADVIAIARRESSLRNARRCGSTHEIVMHDRRQTVDAVKEATEGRLCDRVIECTGAPEPLTLAGELTRIRGKLIVAGYHQDGKRTIDMQLWNWRGIDVINAHERDDAVYVDAMREAVEMVHDGRLNPFPLYTHEFALEDLNEAIRMADERPDGFAKALVKP